AIYPLLCPVYQHVPHLLPGIWNFGKMFSVTILNINTVVELHRLIPVELRRFARKTVVPGYLRRPLPIGYLRLFSDRKLDLQLLTRQVIEVVLRRESYRCIVVAPELLSPFG